jgi:hypothetical protein
MYVHILRGTMEENRHHAHQVSQRLTVAIDPLHAEELVEALAVDFIAEGIPTLNADLR